MELHNLTVQDYRNGIWSTDDIEEDELFNQLAPNITDLIRAIYVKKTNNSEGDEYINIPVIIHNKTNEQALKIMEDHGIEIKRKDYYSHLKTYCFLFRYVHTGLEALPSKKKFQTIVNSDLFRPQTLAFRSKVTTLKNYCFVNLRRFLKIAILDLKASV